MSGFLLNQGTRLAAVALIAGFYLLARLPEPAAGERGLLAGRFKFAQTFLPELKGQWPGHDPASVRAVHPSYANISGWISAVGAGVSLSDLDGDGLPNDLCYVDTRTDLVIVAPAPSTGARYQPFALDPSPLRYDPKTMAPMGALSGDMNEDGRADLLVYYWGRTPVAFLRQGEGYVPREVVAGEERWFTNAATFADLDGDGHADLVIGNYFPDGAHVLDAAGAGRETMQDSMSRAFNGGAKHLLLWKQPPAGGGPAVNYVEAGGLPGAAVERGWTLAVGACDLDGDLLPELYFANDFGPDRLLHNRSRPGRLEFALAEGERTFATPTSKVLGRDSFKGMGVDFADVNGDGLPDIYVSNIAAEYALLESHFLFVNTGRPDLFGKGVAPFVDRSEPLGLARSGWGWDAKLADFDNDGVHEALQATGFRKGVVNRWPELQELAISNDRLVPHVRSWPRFRPGDDLSGGDLNHFFVRGPDGVYVNVGRQVGFDQPQVSRGIAVADVDGDGAQDFAVANQWEASRFYHNRSPRRGTFLGLHLLLPLRADAPGVTAVRPGHPSREVQGRPAIGASAVVHLPDGRRLVAQVDGGNGHSGKRSPDLHFGLGGVSIGTPLRVDLAWRDPSGQVRRETLNLQPGWQTVQLGWPGAKER